MRERTPGYDLSEVPGQLPPDLVPDDVNLDRVAQIALSSIKCLTAESVTEDVQWRDWMSLTGKARTIHGTDAVVGSWTRAAEKKHPQNFEVHSKRVMRPCNGTSWVLVNVLYVTFKQDNGLTGHHSANIALIPYGDTWKIWMMVTILESFEGYGHPDEPQMSLHTQTQIAIDSLDYAVAVVGAGQCGLSLAGRLTALNIPSVVIEKADIGNAWISKYDSVRQHTLREYNNLPFGRTWKQEDPDLLPGAVVSQGFSSFVRKNGVEVWTYSKISECSRDDKSQIWTLKVTSTSSASSQPRTIKVRHLAIAIGAGVSMPSMPRLPGIDKFKGTLIHQSEFRNAKSFAEKRGIIVGTGTSGHDIAQDMFDSGMSVTMVQRSRTAIYPIDWVLSSQKLWNLDMPTGVSDRMGATAPVKMGNEIIDRNMREASKQPKHQALVAGLEKAGFRVDRDSAMLNQIMTRYGGYYIDVGTCKHIVDGGIKVKSGVPIKEVTETGLSFEDGEELPADLIVLATGYDYDYRKSVAGVVGDAIAEELPEFWGLTKDGDTRGWMQENRPGLWMIGGTAPQARWTSRFTALGMLLSLIGVKNVVE